MGRSRYDGTVGVRNGNGEAGGLRDGSGVQADYTGFDARELKYAVDSVEPHNNGPMSSGKTHNIGFYLSLIKFVSSYFLYYQ